MAFYDESIPTENIEAGPQFGSANYDFSFLDNYLNRITSPLKTNTQQTEANGFYDEHEEEVVPEVQDVAENSQQQQEVQPEQQFNQEVNDYLFASDNYDELDYNNYTNKTEEVADENSVAPDSAPFENDYDIFAVNKMFKNTSDDKSKIGNLRDKISAVESGGKYNSTNKNSSAAGKYQFLWSQWGDSIKSVTGVKSKEEFLKSPTAQEKYYGFYEKTYLAPEIQKLRKEVTTNLDDVQLGKLIHFRGAGGAKKYLQGQLSDKPESYNMKISEYIKQTGGYSIAVTPEEQHIGLNNPALDNLIIPLQGTTTIRGLDNGDPVEVTDESGTTKVLRGPKHTFKAKGSVKEKRLKN